ncbi:MAG: RtcB family protein, partial [Acidobacteriota bacterium]|nr:RtcB family protein [Acidobacteriota bacterium]
MKGRELRNLGIPAGEPVQIALKVVGLARESGLEIATIRQRMRELVADPESFRNDETFGRLANVLLAKRHAQASYVPREQSAPYRQWGENLEPESVRQLENACKLPVSVRGALMPDAHRGYGLPIGGVLATRNAVIPYAVGVDIACRVKMSVLDLPVDTLSRDPGKLVKAIETETRFGIGAFFEERRAH